ncbi:MAG: hypothetical protein WCI17_11495 [bacterium]
MRTTVDIPDALYRQVKARSSQEGLAVREVTVALYLQWIEGRTHLAHEAASPAGTGHTEEVDSWLLRMRKLGDGIRRGSKDPRSCTSILAADRR